MKMNGRRRCCCEISCERVGETTFAKPARYVLVPRGDPCVYGLRTAREDAVEYSPCMCSSCAIAHSVRSYQFVLGAGTYGGPMGTVQYCRSLLGEFPRVGASSEQGRFF